LKSLDVGIPFSLRLSCMYLEKGWAMLG
jgi:hypothetical protein